MGADVECCGLNENSFVPKTRIDFPAIDPQNNTDGTLQTQETDTALPSNGRIEKNSRRRITTFSPPGYSQPPLWTLE